MSAPQRSSRSRRVAAETLGATFLLTIVVGSGIMGERLSGGSAGLALLANALATGAGLVALLLALGPVSGAHLNPAVTLMEAFHRRFPWRDVPAYLAAQLLGAFLGVALAHGMFGVPFPYSASMHARAGFAQGLSEGVATFGLLAVVYGTARTRPAATPLAVGAYIASAYWFTASTSFANPAVTLARAATDTFAGIRPLDVPAFLGAQVLATGLAASFFPWLFRAGPHGSDVAGRRAPGGAPALVKVTGPEESA